MRVLENLLVRCTSVRVVLSSRGGLDSALLDLATATERGRLLLDPTVARHLGPRHRMSVRVLAKPSRCMLVFDDRSAVLPLAADDLNVGAMLLRNPLATTYGDLFELMWSDARAPQGGPDETGLSSREAEIVELLLEGATDHQVAARLGMSSRTVRAVVAQLQQRYGTRSRMALGFQLARVTG
ncbi:regulatory protein, luxR family [Lentzea xinjiangensis]|uniref:Regulatory protein, luxR family n=2 Tax=Lentzea xinjiangensis TaxID=402600 RepID=A0A1H9QZ46_9PSEU|nr:regulatory protein, luxR family [Lentzea xinjiangensis]